MGQQTKIASADRNRKTQKPAQSGTWKQPNRPVAFVAYQLQNILIDFNLSFAFFALIYCFLMVDIYFCHWFRSFGFIHIEKHNTNTAQITKHD